MATLRQKMLVQENRVDQPFKVLQVFQAVYSAFEERVKFHHITTLRGPGLDELEKRQRYPKESVNTLYQQIIKYHYFQLLSSP